MSETRRRRTLLIRAAVAGLMALVGTVVASFGDIRNAGDRPGAIVTALAGALIVLLSGTVGVRALSTALREGVAVRAGDARGASLARIVSIAGYIIVVLWALGAAGLNIQALLLGGALTGVVLGIAAQQTLGNVFAGLVLLAVRPFVVGQSTVLKNTLGEYEGTVERIGLFYVTVQTAGGRVDLPNAVALASAVGPGVRTVPDAENGEEPEATPQAPTEGS